MVETVTGGTKLPSRWADAAKSDDPKRTPVVEPKTPSKANSGPRHSPRRTPDKGPHNNRRQSNDGPSLKDRLTLPTDRPKPSEAPHKSPRKHNTPRQRRHDPASTASSKPPPSDAAAAPTTEWNFDENEDFDWADEA
ncbi:hypothetical protein B9G98_00492 [Wickerhamiella sorbophila]|uniref:Uncharacterized protein n=1 Tax=Wickerhamiella sorbophila TaxID=45607 RepID=A0A2T0FCZ0_9ASCO|nr:hypothetical protein B9G98_00492 [Wickerhamiella sorbophila]PRT52872.1 hypothetical protein B9G98_00492 [Wickerhamiella sorbophila]